MTSQTHSSCLILYNEMFVYMAFAYGFCILRPKFTYNIARLNVYLTNNEPGTTIHILYHLIIFNLLLLFAGFF